MRMDCCSGADTNFTSATPTTAAPTRCASISVNDLSLGGVGATKSLRRAYVGAPMELRRMGTRLALSTSLAVKQRATRSRYALIESDPGSNSFRRPYYVVMA